MIKFITNYKLIHIYNICVTMKKKDNLFTTYNLCNRLLLLKRCKHFFDQSTFNMEPQRHNVQVTFLFGSLWHCHWTYEHKRYSVEITYEILLVDQRFFVRFAYSIFIPPYLVHLSYLLHLNLCPLGIGYHLPISKLQIRYALNFVT